MKKQEFMAMSLPYGLKGIDGNGDAAELMALDKRGYFCTDLDLEDDEEEMNILEGNFEPILHPLSDLTKEIEHNGEKFIPIVDLLSLEQNSGLKYAKVNPIVLQITCFGDKGNATYDLEYKDTYQNMEDGIIIFSYSERFRRFSKIMMHPFRQPLSVGFQLDMFKKLIEWHFDIAGLISKGEAIDVNTIENPYL